MCVCLFVSLCVCVSVFIPLLLPLSVCVCPDTGTHRRWCRQKKGTSMPACVKCPLVDWLQYWMPTTLWPPKPLSIWRRSEHKLSDWHTLSIKKKRLHNHSLIEQLGAFIKSFNSQIVLRNTSLHPFLKRNITWRQNQMISCPGVYPLTLCPIKVGRWSILDVCSPDTRAVRHICGGFVKTKGKCRPRHSKHACETGRNYIQFVLEGDGCTSSIIPLFHYLLTLPFWGVSEIFPHTHTSQLQRHQCIWLSNLTVAGTSFGPNKA